MGAFFADGLDAESDTGAVDQTDQLAAANRGGHHRLAVGLLGDVAADEAAADFLGHFLALVGLEIGDDDLATVLGEHPRRAFAEAGSASGDDENLASDFHFCVSLISIQASAASARSPISSTLPRPLMRR